MTVNKFNIILFILMTFPLIFASSEEGGNNAVKYTEENSFYHFPGMIQSRYEGEEKNRNISFGWINDNLTNVSNLPLDGIFGGPDDKYTFAAFFHYSEENWKLLLNYHVITDRFYNHRYDYIYLMYLKNISMGRFKYAYGGGIEGTGDFGGEFLQNSFHSYIGVAEVDIPYTDYDPGLTARGDIEYLFLDLLNSRITLNIYSSLKFSTTRVADSLILALPFNLNINPLVLQLYPGHSFKFSFAEECVSGNSFFYKTALSFPLMKDLLFTFGFSRDIIYSCPASNNLAEYNKFTDTIDEDKDIVTVPQYFFVFSYGGKAPEIRDMPLP